MTTLHLLRLKNIPIYEQLQIEEALLRADERNWCVLNTGSPPAVVMGISGKYQEHINSLKMQAQAIPVIRRFSGGGTVVVDPATHFYTLIGSHTLLGEASSKGVFPEQLLRWTEAVYAPAFEEIDFSLRDNDYVIGEKKFGGNAQYITKQRWLHHSSLLWDYNASLMDYLLMPKKVPAYRQGRAHTDFLCRLSDYFSHSDHFEAQMLKALARRFNLLGVSLEEVHNVLAKEHRRATQLMR